MTEQNHEPYLALGQASEHSTGSGAPPEDAGAEAPTLADAAWPALPSEQDPSGTRALDQDSAVSAVLGRLAAVRQTPVSGHGELYAGMHDSLLEALNQDVAGPAGVARRIHAAGDGDS